MINQLETLNLPKIPDTRAEDILNIVCQGRYNTLTPPKTGEDGVIQNGSMIKNLSNVLLGEKGTFGIRAMSAFKEYTLSSRQYASRFGVQIFRDIQNKVSSVLKKNPESMEQRKQQAMDKLAAIKDPKMAFEMIKNIKEAGLDVNNTTQEKLCLNLILAELRKLQTGNNGLLKFIAFRRTQLVDTITRNLTDREMEFLALTFLRDIQAVEKDSQADFSKATSALAGIKNDDSGLLETERRYGGFTWLTKFITNKATLGAGASVIGLNTVLTGLGMTAATSVLAPVLPFVGGIAAVGGVMTLVQAIGVADYMSFSLPNLIKIYTDPKFIEIFGRKKAAELLEVAVEKYVTETGKYNKKEMKNILRNILSADFLGADADLAKLSNISQQERTIVLQIIQNLKASSNPVGTNEAIKNQQEAIRNQEIDKLAEPTHNSLKKIWNTLSGFGERAKNTIDNVKSKLGFEESDLLGDIKKGAKNFGLNVLEKLDTITFGKKDGLTLKDRIAPEMTKYLARQIYLENKDKFQGDPKGSVEVINKNLGAYLSEFYLTLEEITGMISRAVIEYNLYTAERAKGLAFGAGSTMASSAGLGLIFSSGVGWREIADVTTNNQWDNVLYGAGETGIKVVDKIVGTKTANAAEAQTVGQAAIETAPSQRLGAGDYLEAGNIKLKLNPDGSVAEQEIKINIPGKGQLNVKILGGMSPQETVKVLNNSAELNKTVESILATPAPAVEPPKPNNLLSQFANSVKSRIDVLRGEQPNSNPAEQQNPAMENPNNVAKVDPTFNNFNNFVQDITLKADNLIQALENRAGSEEIIRKLREFKSGQITDYAEVKDFSQATKEMRDEFLKLEKEAKELLLKEKPAPKPEPVQQAAWLKLNKVLNKTTEFVTNVVNQTNQNVLASAEGLFIQTTTKNPNPLFEAVAKAGKMFDVKSNNTFNQDTQVRITILGTNPAESKTVTYKQGDPVVAFPLLSAIGITGTELLSKTPFKVEVLGQSEPVVAQNPTPETPTTAEQSKNKPETSAVPETLETNVIKPVLAQIDNKIIELAGLGTGEAKNLITRMDQFRIELRNTNFRNGDDLKKATEYKNSLLAKADELLNPQVTNTATNPTQPADVSNSPGSILNKLMNGVATTAQDLRNKAEQVLGNTEEKSQTPPAENSNQIPLSGENEKLRLANGVGNQNPIIAKALESLKTEHAGVFEAIESYNQAINSKDTGKINEARAKLLAQIKADPNVGKVEATTDYIKAIEKRLIAETQPTTPPAETKQPTTPATEPKPAESKTPTPATEPKPATPTTERPAAANPLEAPRTKGSLVYVMDIDVNVEKGSFVHEGSPVLDVTKLNLRQADIDVLASVENEKPVRLTGTDSITRIIVRDEKGDWRLADPAKIKLENTATQLQFSQEYLKALTSKEGANEWDTATEIDRQLNEARKNGKTVDFSLQAIYNADEDKWNKIIEEKRNSTNIRERVFDAHNEATRVQMQVNADYTEYINKPMSNGYSIKQLMMYADQLLAPANPNLTTKHGAELIVLAYAVQDALKKDSEGGKIFARALVELGSKEQPGTLLAEFYSRFTDNGSLTQKTLTEGMQFGEQADGIGGISEVALLKKQLKILTQELDKARGQYNGSSLNLEGDGQGGLGYDSSADQNAAVNAALERSGMKIGSLKEKVALINAMNELLGSSTKYVFDEKGNLTEEGYEIKNESTSSVGPRFGMADPLQIAAAIAKGDISIGSLAPRAEIVAIEGRVVAMLPKNDPEYAELQRQAEANSVVTKEGFFSTSPSALLKHFVNESLEERGVDTNDRWVKFATDAILSQIPNPISGPILGGMRMPELAVTNEEKVGSAQSGITAELKNFDNGGVYLPNPDVIAVGIKSFVDIKEFNNLRKEDPSASTIQLLQVMASRNGTPINE